MKTPKNTTRKFSRVITISRNAVCDYYINQDDTSSHADSPEHEIVFCNEIIKQRVDVPTYPDLSLLGVKLTNSKEWSSFSNVSAYITEGIKVERLEQGDTGATNLFPNIAYALLTDRRLGAGDAIGEASVDNTAMTTAARYCQANQFFWDGVIDESLNLRSFIYEQAAFCLLDFTIKGGKFALFPSLPFHPENHRIHQNGKPEVRALFTDGVVRKCEVSFLSPEERQPFVAVCFFREETTNGFPETRSLRCEYARDEMNQGFPVEEFDMTRFCTSERQARLFSRVALQLRRHVDHGIKFETTPQAAMHLEPGQYFKFASKVTHTDRFSSGVIDDKGNIITSQPTEAASITVVYWKPGTTEVKTATLNISDNKTTQQELWGSLWTKQEKVRTPGSISANHSPIATTVLSRSPAALLQSQVTADLKS